VKLYITTDSIRITETTDEV